MSILGKIKNFLILVLFIAFLLFAVKVIIGQFKFEKNAPIIKENLVELIKVVDGDTMVIKINDNEETVRLIGIDTPEKNECYEKEATEKLKNILTNKNIKIEADESQNDRDKYDRLLRYIYLEDGTLINKKLIEEGVAKEYTYKIPYKFQTEFKTAEEMAKKEKIGIWADGICPKN